MSELEQARALALAAGLVLRERQPGATSRAKPDGSPVSDADLAANQVIIEGLRTSFPGDRVVSEEADDAVPAAIGAGRTWLVDPLDGTRDYLARSPDAGGAFGAASRLPATATSRRRLSTSQTREPVRASAFISNWISSLAGRGLAPGSPVGVRSSSRRGRSSRWCTTQRAAGCTRRSPAGAPSAVSAGTGCGSGCRRSGS